MVELYKQGRTGREIADHLGVVKSTVYQTYGERKLRSGRSTSSTEPVLIGEKCWDGLIIARRR